MIEADPPSVTEGCIWCRAGGARLVCKKGEQVGDLHRFSKRPQIVDMPDGTGAAIRVPSEKA